MKGTCSLYFPTIVTLLCALASVKWDDKAAAVLASKIINKKTIKSYKIPIVRGATSSTTTIARLSNAPTSPPHQPLTMIKRMENLENAFQEHHVEFHNFQQYQMQMFQNLECMVQVIANTIGVDMNQFPFVGVSIVATSFPPPPDIAAMVDDMAT